MALSVDSVEANKEWLEDVEAYNSTQLGRPVKLRFPIISDGNRAISEAYSMIDQYSMGQQISTVRYVFLIDPENIPMLRLDYPSCVGVSTASGGQMARKFLLLVVAPVDLIEFFLVCHGRDHSLHHGVASLIQARHSNSGAPAQQHFSIAQLPWTHGGAQGGRLFVAHHFGPSSQEALFEISHGLRAVGQDLSAHD